MKLILCLLALLLPTNAWAEDFLGEASPTMAAIGVSANYKAEKGKQTTVVITIDFDKYLRSIPILQSMGIINHDIKQTTINKSPYHLVGFATIFFGSAIIPEAYRTHPDADRIHFSEISISSDDYGNDESHELVSFDFTRNIFQKINWGKFHEGALPKIAIDFKPTPFFARKVAEEPPL